MFASLFEVINSRQRLRRTLKGLPRRPPTASRRRVAYKFDLRATLTGRFDVPGRPTDFLGVRPARARYVAVIERTWDASSWNGQQERVECGRLRAWTSIRRDLR